MASARQLAIAIALTVAFSFWMYDRAPVSHAGGDSLWVVHTSASLITDRDLDLSEYSPLIDAYPAQPPPHLIEVDGERVDFFPWGAAVVAMPFVAAHAVATDVAGGDFADRLETTLPLFDVERRVAASIAALTVGLLLFVLHLRLRSVAWATGLALTFALGTGVMSTTSRNLWIQGPGLLLVVGVLAIGQVVADRRGELSRIDAALAIAAGPIVALAYATRPPLALLGPVLLWLFWARGRWRLAAAFAGSTSAALLVVFAVNIGTYGDWLPAYNRYHNDRIAAGGSFFEALLAHLVSPSRGLFVWTPVVLVGIVWCALRRDRTSTFDRLVLAWIGVHLLAVSSFDIWWGGASVGPRLMLDVVPGLFLLLTGPIDELRTLPERARRRLLAGFAVAVLWAGFVNVRAAHRMSVMLWNWPSEAHPSIEDDPGRVWDWSDPQFFR